MCIRDRIRNAFIPPTALRMLRAARNPQGRHALKMRSIGSGGETLGAETYEWGKQAFGLTINEFYGQTECNLVLSACGALGVSRPGAIGKPVLMQAARLKRAKASLMRHNSCCNVIACGHFPARHSS